MPDIDTATDDALVALTALSRALREGGYTKAPVEYRRVYMACVSGRIPAEQDDGGRWWIRHGHLSEVAAALNLTPARTKVAA